MTNIETYDLVVIGGGPAGVSAANTAAVLGQRVALVEKQCHVGGAGINSGTLPSKTLRETALALSGWRSRDLFGVDLSLRRDATISDFMHHYRQVREHERQRLEGRLEDFNVHTYIGTARFDDPHTVIVEQDDEETVTLKGEVILIAVGSVPMRPAIFPFENYRVHDSDELLEINELPKKLAVIGAGVVGSEYACTFAALGAEVHLIDGRDRLLPFLDKEISLALELALGKTMRIHWNERVTACDISDPANVRLTLTSGLEMDFDGVLICAGRTSRVDALNLSAAGITPGPRGAIPVDNHYRSIDVPHIYAAGDVIGPPALASTSMEQARIAVCDAFGAKQKQDMAQHLPTGIYTIPEASMVGETEESLKEKGIKYIVGRSRYSEHPRGRIVGDNNGFLKLLFADDDMKLLGVHVIGEHATELVHIGMMVMLSDGGADIFNRGCFNYPTFGDLYKYATYDAMLQRMNHQQGYSGAG